MPLPTTALLQRCRRPTFRSWWAVALFVALLAVEAFAVSHPLDSAAHANGDHCYVCVSLASFGHGAIAALPSFALDAASVVVPMQGRAAHSTASIPKHPPVRGPPAVS